MTVARIALMPPDLALKIAAGEVVERPASAVKELLDNAIDAGATQVRVDVREGGLKQIRVVDNGQGIVADDVHLAFQSHATSKIAHLDDLERLTTLGFRGEALPSIAAVARVEIVTRHEQDGAGTRLVVEFGGERRQGHAAAPRGTQITVADLFSNVPARRKFVKSIRAEGGQITALLHDYALAQPQVRFTLVLDGRTCFESPGTGRLADAVAAVYGPAVVQELIPVRADDHGVAIDGLISTPALSRPTRAGIRIFANGRPIANRSLVFALEEAYSGFLMVGRHPVAAVHIRVPPGELDANVHPAKTEVRFAGAREVHGVLHRAAADALLELRLRERGAATYLDPEPVESETDLPSAQPLPLGTEGPTAETPYVPALRVVGQTGATFILAEGPDGLYMIDQHAAHERVLYDRFDAESEAGPVTAQPLLEPASVPLDPAQMAALETSGELLAALGFTLEPFGTDTCLVRSIPALSARGGPVELVQEVLSELSQLAQPAAARERAIAAMACKAAVKAGQTLAVDEMRELVVALETTARPQTCPHGRPTMIHLSHSRLEREFGRR